jgi:hypothetical protein
VASIVGLLKYNSLLKNRLQIKKAQLENTTEKLRAEYTATILANLQKTIASILPSIAEHNRAIQESNLAIKVVSETVALAQVANIEAKKIINSLLKQHEEFLTRMAHVQQGGELVISRLSKIETVVEELKSGNIFVRTKK